MPPSASKLPAPRRLILSRPDRLGDVVITTACLEAIHHQLPNTELFLAVREPYAFMLADNPYLTDTVPLPSRGTLEWIKKTFRELKADAIVHLNPDSEIENAAHEASILTRIGYSRNQGEKLSAWLPYQWKKQGTQHEAYYTFDLLEPFGLTPPTLLKPRVAIPKAARAWADKNLPDKNTVLIHLASYGNKPRVPATFYAELAKRLIEQNGSSIVVVGADAEDVSIPQFFSSFQEHKGKLYNLAGNTSIEQLAALCASARLMVSRDSGPAHLAAAVHCPTMTFFINSISLMSPTRWCPLGPYTRIYTKQVCPLPFESPHFNARRIIRKYNIEEAYQEAMETMKSKQTSDSKNY